ncbi:MAG: DNA cytosine methyltransferase [Dysgonamonadaceae bacterium]|jgi:DNA (cytosine-5)-methyltransferase 3A|nr:DNA cytosine methyltransferase [Dysgonamonadaceae bacterium]
MNVLSLCDGMSCGQIALAELGIEYDKYYASEIDKHAIGQTQLNFQDTIQLGSIEDWKNWDIDWVSIGLILAGTPCTGFSFAGKGLAFDDPQSRLFFIFVEILNHTKKHNPDVIFMLENVRMKKKYLRIISEMVNVFPVMIDSALVSAQTRKRYYWSNIRTQKIGLFGELHTDIQQPNDKEVLLKDILDDEVNEKYYVSDKVLKYITKHSRLDKKYTQINGNKSLTLTYNGINNWNGNYIFSRGHGFNKGNIYNEKSPTLTSGHDWVGNNCIVKINKKGVCGKNQNKSSCFTAGGNSGGNHSDMDLVVQLNKNTENNGCQPYQQNRIYDINYKSPALLAEMSSSTHAISTDRIRRLTPTECARLQTIPEWYKWECSDSQQYKMLGNGWTVEVIKHILSYLPLKFYGTQKQTVKQINTKTNKNHL